MPPAPFTQGSLLEAFIPLQTNPSVRNSRAASALRGHPRAPLRTGLPPPRKAQSKPERREGACNRAAEAQRRPFAVEEGQGSGWSFRLAGGSGAKRTLARRGSARLHPQPDFKGPGISPRKRPKARRSIAKALATEQRRCSDGLLRRGGARERRDGGFFAYS